jgi:hypothetical protein
LRGLTTGGCASTKATCSVRARAVVRACCPLGSLRLLVVARSVGELGRLGRPTWAGGVGNMQGFSGLEWRGHSVRGATIAGEQATPYPSPCAVMSSYLAVVYEPCLQRVVAVRLMWAAFGYGACYGACSYGAQRKAPLQGRASHASANALGSSVQLHPTNECLFLIERSALHAAHCLLIANLGESCGICG